MSLKKGRNLPVAAPEAVPEVNRRFMEEVLEFGLVYRCGDCVHGNPEAGSCVLGYPNRVLAEGDVRALDERGFFVFCKDFELND